MGHTLFRKQSTSAAVREFFGQVIRRTGAAPRRLLTDQGKQFRDRLFRRWLCDRDIRQRFGALGLPGSIVLVENFIGTLKRECTRRLLVPFTGGALRTELELFSAWYNRERPHNGLSAATPDEAYCGVEPACLRPRFEPRKNWPRVSPCAAPRVPMRPDAGARIELHVAYLGWRKHLPIVTVRLAA